MLPKPPKNLSFIYRHLCHEKPSKCKITYFYFISPNMKNNVFWSRFNFKYHIGPICYSTIRLGIWTIFGVVILMEKNNKFGRNCSYFLLDKIIRQFCLLYNF